MMCSCLFEFWHPSPHLEVCFCQDKKVGLLLQQVLSRRALCFQWILDRPWIFPMMIFSRFRRGHWARKDSGFVEGGPAIPLYLCPSWGWLAARFGFSWLWSCSPCPPSVWSPFLKIARLQMCLSMVRVGIRVVPLLPVWGLFDCLFG